MKIVCMIGSFYTIRSAYNFPAKYIISTVRTKVPILREEEIGCRGEENG